MGEGLLQLAQHLGVVKPGEDADAAIVLVVDPDHAAEQLEDVPVGMVAHQLMGYLACTSMEGMQPVLALRSFSLRCLVSR